MGNAMRLEDGTQASELHAAVADDDPLLVQQLLSDGVSQVDELNKRGKTPLYVAAENGNADIVGVLLRHGARVRKGTEICDRTSEDEDVSQWKNPLFVAKTLVIVDMLIDAGADINDTDYRGDTVLHTSARYCELPFVEYFVRKGLCVNVVNQEGLTPLHEVCNGSGFLPNCLSVLQLLLASGADINAQTFSGRTPLHYGCDMRSPVATVRELLSKGAKLDIANFEGDYPVHTCIKTLSLHENLELSTLLVKSVDISNLKDARGRTMLHIASERCGKDFVETIIANSLHTCVNEPDNIGKSPLHHAALYKSKKNGGVISCLLEKGAHINAVDAWGQTALHEASRVDNVDALEQLLADSCDVNVTDVTGVTALHVACLNNSVRSVEQLLPHLADINCCDNNKSSLIHFAAWNCDTDTVLVDLLLKHGIDMFQKDALGHTCLDIAVFRRNSKIYSALTEHMQVSQKSELINELSSVGNTKMEYTDLCELLNKEDGIKRCISDAEQYVSMVLTLPGVGRGADEDEAMEIKAAIEDLIQTLAERIGQADSRFKCIVLHAGSMSEGTKTRLPDEFDFMFCFEELSKHSEPEFHEGKLGEYTGNVTKMTVLKIQKNGIEYLNKFQTDGFSAVRLKNNEDSDALLKFAGSKYISIVKMSCTFSQLIEKTIYDKTFPKHQQLMITSVCPASITVQWRGSMYKQLDIDIDMVPAIILPHWPEQTRKGNVLMTPDILRISCVGVPKEVLSGDYDLWRRSMSLVETCIFRKLRPEIRNSYIACKALVTSDILPDMDLSVNKDKRIQPLTSYILKMAFLHAVEKKAKRNGLDSVYSKTTTGKSTNVVENAANQTSEQKYETIYMRSDKDSVKTHKKPSPVYIMVRQQK